MLGWWSGQTHVSVKDAPYGYASPNLAPSTLADVAQLVERILGKNEVSGSIPDVGSKVKI